MSERPTYFDVRQEFWRRHVELAASYEDYLAGSDPAQAGRWRKLEGALAPLGEEEGERLRGYGRPMFMLVSSGIWCGDCVRQVPMLQRIALACGPDVQLRILDREAAPELRDELRVLGAARVPMVVYLSEDFHEVGRFGDRSLTTYRAKATRELGPACDAGILPPPPDELTAEQSEWVDITERMLLMLRLSPPLRERHGD